LRNRFLGRVDRPEPIWFDAGVKLLLVLCALALGATSCTTLSNRRDLYNPSEDTGPYNAMQQEKAGPPGPRPALRDGAAPSPQ
jgi:hypothetical protein